MAKIESIDDIEVIEIHWTESNHINEMMGCDENCDIEKPINPYELESMIGVTVHQLGSGYDKISLSIELKNGLQWCKESKFYISADVKCLLDLLNKGED
jgi:hypothetical protein